MTGEQLSMRTYREDENELKKMKLRSFSKLTRPVKSKGRKRKSIDQVSGKYLWLLVSNGTSFDFDEN